MKIKHILIYLILSFSLPVLSQTTISVPYFCGFEDAAENANWQFANGTNTNKWTIGSAVSNIGANSLYISSDGGNTAGHNAAMGYVSAYRDFQIGGTDPAVIKTFRISFDWYNPESNGKLYVAWIPENYFSVPANQKWNGTSDLAPPSHITIYGKPWKQGGDTLMQNSSRFWFSASFEVNCRETEIRRLLFHWGSSTDSKGKSGGAIDNVQVFEVTSCGSIANLDYKLNENGIGVFTWSGGPFDTTYDLRYKDMRNPNGPWIEHTNLTTPNVTVNPKLGKGIYSVWVRKTCGNDTSGWYVHFPFLVYEEKVCIDFWNINSKDVVATTGTYKFPYSQLGVVDLGSPSANSRHTVHFDEDEYDAQTGYKLKTIPDGSLVSIRLGNWLTGAQAESIIFKYRVDADAGLLLLKYAPVMQDPEHSIDNQPRFKLEILDENSNLIGYCGEEDFIAGSATDNWEKLNMVRWKKWTSFGVDLRPYIGQTLQIRLTTFDCSQGAHFGYTYFTLECLQAKIRGVTCGDNQVDSLIAPDGFQYKWYKKYDPNETPVSVKQEFVPQKGDTATYICEMSYKEGVCSFSLEAILAPRYVECQFDQPQIVYRNCEAEVRLKNNSFTWTKNNPKYGDCDNYFWDFGDGRTSREKEPRITYNTPGTYKISLTSDIVDGTCWDYDEKTIVIPEFKSTADTIQAYVCSGHVFEYNKKFYTTTGTYADTLRTYTDCDSIKVIQLKIEDELLMPIIVDTLFQYRQPYYEFNGKQLTQTGVYIDTLQAHLGCDSIVALNLTVYPALDMEITIDYFEICADNPVASLEYKINAGSVSTYSLIFEDTQTSGFINIENEVFTNPTTIDIDIPKYIRPSIYNATVVFEDYYHGNKEFHIKISVFYPNTVIEQKWNDVIAILTEDYNGGYTYVAPADYQWYKNEEPIPYQTKSYLYVPEGLDVNSQYKVLITSSDGVAAFTCPLIPVIKTDIKAHPTILRAGEQINVSMSKIEEGEFSIWNIMGQKIKTDKFFSQTFSIRTPEEPGVYSLLINTTSGEKEIYKIILK